MRLFMIILFLPTLVFAAVGFGISTPGTVDTRLPEITLLRPLEGDQYQSEVVFEWAISEDSLSSVPDALRLQVIAPGDSLLYEWSTPMLPEGVYLHTWEVIRTLPSGTFWTLEARDAFGNLAQAVGGSFDCTDGPEDPSLPTVPTLAGAWPNPFNPRTKIRFSLPEAQVVQLKIYDLSGRLVCPLVEERLQEGWHEKIWDAGDQSSGIYLLRMETDTNHYSTKLVLLK